MSDYETGSRARMPKVVGDNVRHVLNRGLPRREEGVTLRNLDCGCISEEYQGITVVSEIAIGCWRHGVLYVIQEEP